MININRMLAEAKRIANDATSGYAPLDGSLSRVGPDYDCSSFVAHCINAAGGSVNPQMNTRSEHDELINAGFIEIAFNAPNMPGDIYYYDEGGGPNGHTFIIYDSTRYVHAAGTKGNPETGDQSQHIVDGFDTAGEICFGTIPYSFGSHTWHHMRYAPVLNWITGNKVLTDAERENNAYIIYRYFINAGYSLNAISALLGNMEYESYLCPDKWQNRLPPYGPNTGYGLIQWTPYTDYANNYSDAMTNHNRQLEWINSGDAQNYTPTHAYPISWTDFKTSNLAIDYLVRAYFYNRERGTWDDSRVTFAQKWYDYFSGYIPPTPIGKLPIWLLLKIKNDKNNWGSIL